MNRLPRWAWLAGYVLAALVVCTSIVLAVFALVDSHSTNTGLVATNHQLAGANGKLSAALTAQQASARANGAPVVTPPAKDLGGGSPGPAGASIVGPQGPPGPAGRDGQSPPCLSTVTACEGLPGTAGPQGAPGANGASITGQGGATGKDGTNGATGPAGPAGAPGMTGPAGPAGAAGAPGTPGQSAFPFGFTFTNAGTTYACTVTSSTAGTCTAQPPTTASPALKTRSNP